MVHFYVKEHLASVEVTLPRGSSTVDALSATEVANVTVRLRETTPGSLVRSRPVFIGSRSSLLTVYLPPAATVYESIFRKVNTYQFWYILLYSLIYAIYQSR